MQSKQPTKSPIKGARNDIRRESHGTERHLQTQHSREPPNRSVHGVNSLSATARSSNVSALITPLPNRNTV